MFVTNWISTTKIQKTSEITNIFRHYFLSQTEVIPTMQGGVETIRPYVEEFIIFAHQHPELHFLVTPIGCGIAGFEAEDIAPLFESAKEMKNISLPESFWEVIE